MKEIDVFWRTLLIFLLLSNNGYSQEEIQELIVNGNMATTSLRNYDYSVGGYVTFEFPFSGNSVQGSNANTWDPVNFNSSFLPIKDHNDGGLYSGTMLVVDGGNLGNAQYFWMGGSEGNGFCGLTIGKKYTFSYWVHSVSSLVTNPSNQADIRIDFSNVSDVTLVSGSTLAQLPSEGWKKVTYTFIPTSYCVNINLWNANTSSVGNDFAIDDFSLMEEIPLKVTYSLSYSSDGIRLFPYTIAGSRYMRSWLLTGPVNKNGLENFENLIPGNYVLTVVDVNGQTASCDVVIPFKPDFLTIDGNKNICQGGSAALSATGGNSIYEWYSYPTDVSMTNSSSATQIVSPLLTTNYVVKSRPILGTENLIFNGDFSLGNIGFDTWQKYYSTNFENAPRTYNVLKDPSSWNPNFLNCGDHTSGNGNMLVVNSNIDGENNYGSSVWEQSVDVVGTTNYVFSFWVYSLSEINPAELYVSINGSLYNVYPFIAPSSKTCGNWVKFSVNYFSGWQGPRANIAIFSKKNTFIGNDFAIDDISLIAVNPTDIYSNFTVTVSSPIKPILVNKSIAQNEIQFNWNQVPQATEYEVSYSVNNGGMIDGGITTTNSYEVNGLNSGDLVKLIVKPIGNGCFATSEFSANTYLPCPTPVVSIIKQPNCYNPIGSVVVNSPLGSEYEYSLDGINFQSNVLFTSVSSGNQTVTVKNKVTNCQSVSNPVVLNSPDAVLPNISASYNYADCLVNIMATSTTSNHSIVWNGPSLAIDTPNPAKVSVSGVFTATVKDLNTGCTKTFDLGVVQPVKPTTPLLNGINPTCNNDYGDIIVNSPIGINYAYSIDGVNFQSNTQFSNLLPKKYSVLVKDVLTSCISSAAEIVLTKPIIAVPQIVPNNDNLCQNSVSSSLSAVALPNATLNWYGVNETGGVSSTVPTIPSTSNIGTMVYYVSQSIGNCESLRAPIVVSVSDVGINPGFSDLSFCKGEIVTPLSNISPNGIGGNWTPSIIDNLESKSYYFTPNTNQCAVEQTINVTINDLSLKTIKWEVSKAFGDNQTIKIVAYDESDYLYQLDDGVLQESPVFEQVSRGYHTIRVLDKNGCSDPISDNVLIVDFPNYFTPNGDGYNELWNISDLKYQENSSVLIYDRYGKLLKELFPSNDTGWDGTYLGKKMPATDYWFVVYYEENGVKSEFKGHFSLKR